MDDPATLTILGATGYTGRLCAAEAARRGLRVRLAGRRRDALEVLAGQLGGASVGVVDLDDPPSLRRALAGSRVLLSAVGPYELRGRPVVDAALAAGCSYIDLAAELWFLEWVYHQDARAADAGVTLCPGAGADGVGELAAVLAARALAGPVTEARVAYLVRRGALSGGSTRSALFVVAGGGAAWAEGKLIPEPVGARCWAAPFPEPLGVRRALSVPTADVATLGRSTGAPTARAFAVVPGAAIVPPVAGALGRLTAALADSPVWSAARRAAEHLPPGPSPAARARTRLAVLAEVVGPGGSRHAWVRLRDLYATSARVAVGLAGRLAAGDPPPPGARSPGQLLGADTAGFLDEVGVAWARR